MTEKRYFKREWEEGYFIFDSEKITEKEVDEQIDYDVSVFADALTGDENVELLNHLHEENIQLKQCLKKIEKELREYNELIWNNEAKEMYPLKEEGKQYRS